MIALNNDRNHEARDAAFERTTEWNFVRVVRIIPVCCGQPMIYNGAGAGRMRYYKCKACSSTASGTTTREKLP